MKLEKKLIKFYKKSKALESARLDFKQLKKSPVKLNAINEITLFDIQDAIDHQTKMKALSNTIDTFPGKLLGIQREIVTVLKIIGFASKTIIKVNDVRFGEIRFWYVGTNLQFDELKK